MYSTIRLDRGYISRNPWLKSSEFFLKKNKQWVKSNLFEDEEEQELTGMGGEESKLGGEEE